MSHNHSGCNSTPKSIYRGRHHPKERNTKHSHSPNEKRNPHNCPQNIPANHPQTGHSCKEQIFPTRHHDDHDPVRRRLSFGEDDLTSLVEAVEEINRSNIEQEKEASYRQLQNYISDIAQTIRNYEPEIQAKQGPSQTFDQDITNAEYKINMHILGNLADIEKEISDIEDQFNPRWTSSRISVTSDRVPKYQDSTNRTTSKGTSVASDEFLPLIEGSIYSTSPSQSFQSYGSPKYAYEDQSTRYIYDQYSPRQDKANRSERHDDFPCCSLHRNFICCSENMSPTEHDSYGNQILQNIQNEKIERMAEPKISESYPSNTIYGEQREFVNNLPGFWGIQKLPIATRRESSLGPISEQRRIKFDDESNEFVCKTVIVQTVKKYPPFAKGMLQPVSRLLAPLRPDTVAYQETLYDEQEKDGPPKRTSQSPASYRDDDQERGVFGAVKDFKLEKGQIPGTSRQKDHHKRPKDVRMYKEAEDAWREHLARSGEISSGEYLGLLGVNRNLECQEEAKRDKFSDGIEKSGKDLESKTMDVNEDAKSDKFLDEIEKSGKEFKSKIMNAYPSATDASLALSAEALEKLGPTDDEEWDEYIALAQTVSKELTIEPKRSLSFHR